jgi:hypothetical protein
VTPWPDYMDARRRLIAKWREEAVDIETMVDRLTPTRGHVEAILRQSIDPPIPGSSRELVAILTARVAELERIVHAVAIAIPDDDIEPSLSDVRELAPGPERA